MSLPSSRPTLLLRFTLGLVYFHFGFLKLFPDLSGAEMLAGQTMLRLGIDVSINHAVVALGVAECAIGILLMLGVATRLALLLFFVHMVGTFAPLVVLPELAFKFAPFAPTFEGQYILKNVVFIVAGWVVLADENARRRDRSQPIEARNS